MAKTFELMEELMPAPSGNKPVAGSPGSRVRELGLVLPEPPTPLGAYIESSDAGNLLFLSGMLPVVDRKLAISGRLGENLSVKQGQEAARGGVKDRSDLNFDIRCLMHRTASLLLADRPAQRRLDLVTKAIIAQGAGIS